MEMTHEYLIKELFKDSDLTITNGASNFYDEMIISGHEKNMIMRKVYLYFKGNNIISMVKTHKQIHDNPAQDFDYNQCQSTIKLVEPDSLDKLYSEVLDWVKT